MNEMKMNYKYICFVKLSMEDGNTLNESLSNPLLNYEDEK